MLAVFGGNCRLYRKNGSNRSNFSMYSWLDRNSFAQHLSPVYQMFLLFFSVTPFIYLKIFRRLDRTSSFLEIAWCLAQFASQAAILSEKIRSRLYRRLKESQPSVQMLIWL